MARHSSGPGRIPGRVGQATDIRLISILCYLLDASDAAKLYLYFQSQQRNNKRLSTLRCENYEVKRSGHAPSQIAGSLSTDIQGWKRGGSQSNSGKAAAYWHCAVAGVVQEARRVTVQALVGRCRLYRMAVWIQAAEFESAGRDKLTPAPLPPGGCWAGRFTGSGGLL